jgi:hypothetical protein
MNRIGLRHISPFYGIKKFDKTFYEVIFVVMTTTAGIWLFLEPTHFNTVFWGDEPKSMATDIPCFSTFARSGHMACDTTSEGMKFVSTAVFHGLMTTPAEFISL